MRPTALTAMILSGDAGVAAGGLNMRRTALAAAILAAGAALLAAAPAPPATAPAKLPFTIARDTTVITSPLHADGTPDYVAALNARYGKDVTPGNNALVEFIRIRGIDEVVERPELRDAFLKQAGLQPLPPDTAYFRTRATYLQSQHEVISSEIATREMNTALAGPWTADQIPGFAEYLHAEEPFLDLGVDASKKPVLFAPFLAGPGEERGIEVMNVSGWTDFARLWATRITLRAGSGTLDGAIDDVADMKHFGRLFPRSELLTQLFGMVFDLLDQTVSGKIIAAGHLSAAQCDRLEKAFEVPPPTSFAEPLDNLERYILLNGMIDISLGHAKATHAAAADDQQTAAAKSITTAVGSIDPAAVDWNWMLREANAYRDRQIAVVSAPTYKSVRSTGDALKSDYDRWQKEFNDHHQSLAPEPGEAEAVYSARVFHGMMGVVPFLDLARYEASHRDNLLRESMLPLLLRAAKSKAQTGKWPRLLGDFAPIDGKEVPIDPYGSGNARVQYVLIGNQPRVFSVGADGKANTDDDLFVGAAITPGASAPTGELP